MYVLVVRNTFPLQMVDAARFSSREFWGLADHSLGTAIWVF
jgi:hypothetical protein